MYVFGGYSGEGNTDDLYALHLSSEWFSMLDRYLVRMRNAAQRWFKFDNVGPSPHSRSAHTMASDGTRVFVLGGYSEGARSDEISLIHVFDTSMCVRFVNLSGQPSKLRIQNTSSTQNPSVTLSIPMRGPPNLRGSHPQVPRPRSNHDTRNPLHRRPTVLPICKMLPPLYRAALPPCRLLTSETPGPNGRSLELTGVNSRPRHVPEDDVSEGSTEYHAKFAAPHSSSEGEVARLELERQLSGSLATQTERDQRIAQLTDELALKSALLEQSEINAAEAAKRAGLELREHADRLLTQTSLVKQRDAELVDMQTRLDELLLSRDSNMKRNLQTCVPSSRRRSPNWRQSDYDSRTLRRV
jgi:hypothetical protein